MSTYATVTVTIGHSIRTFDVATPVQVDAIRRDAESRGAAVTVSYA